MNVSELSKRAGQGILKKLGRAKRRSTFSIAATVFGVATAGVAIGYGVKKALGPKKDGASPDAADQAPKSPPDGA